MEFLHQKILDNTVEKYLWFAGIMLFAFLFKRYISGILGTLIYNFFRRYTKDNRVKQFNTLIFRPASWLIMLLTASFALQLLNFPKAWEIKNCRVRVTLHPCKNPALHHRTHSYLGAPPHD